MVEQIFCDPPSIELLQWLARGSLKQNFLRAVRLWCWLRSLYGNPSDKIMLEEPFTFAQWRNAFFSATHPSTEAQPPLHDPKCPCAFTAAQWLFDLEMGRPAPAWRESLAEYGSVPDDLDALLASRLFGVTRRSLAGDARILAELGWLKRGQHCYQRVKQWPSRPHSQAGDAVSQALSVQNFLNPDLAMTADTFSGEMGSSSRFFLHVDYVVPKETLDRIEDWQAQLKQLWQQTPISCIRIEYDSAKLSQTVECIVYPVCIYYVQRATYLVAWGRTPSEDVGWYNYRLDRVETLESVAWEDARIPETVIVARQDKKLPGPDYIQLEMANAWGFDFYQPALLMLLRFDWKHHQRYIQNTRRHETFEQVSYEEAGQLIRENAAPEEVERLLEVWQARSPADAYYRANYRDRDPNVLMRLLAWCPYVEVLLPMKLRHRMGEAIARQVQCYQSP